MLLPSATTIDYLIQYVLLFFLKMAKNRVDGHAQDKANAYGKNKIIFISAIAIRSCCPFSGGESRKKERKKEESR